jgi:hypothetical protein
MNKVEPIAIYAFSLIQSFEDRYRAAQQQKEQMTGT